MAQHFLLSAASRTLSLRQIYKAGEDAAYQTFCEMRWPETTVEALRAHPRLAKFIAWVAQRPPGFHSKTPGARRKR